jgi:hypothetical protein
MIKLPLRIVELFADRCVAETSDRQFIVKFQFEPDERPYAVGETIGTACTKTSLVKLDRKFRHEGDYEPDKLALIPEKKEFVY